MYKQALLETIPPTWEQLGVLISLALPAVFYFSGRWFDKRKDAKSVENIEADTDQTKVASRKLEAEVAQNYISSANALVEEYKEMLRDLNNKYTALEQRQEITESKLDLEIKKRKESDIVLKELYRGIKILLAQFSESNVKPRWIPDEKTKSVLEQLEKGEK